MGRFCKVWAKCNSRPTHLARYQKILPYKVMEFMMSRTCQKLCCSSLCNNFHNLEV
jgi:hypothetical protein